MRCILSVVYRRHDEECRRDDECEFTESQNGRVGRDLYASSSPIPLPKQGHLQQAAQDLAQAGLEYL